MPDIDIVDLRAQLGRKIVDEDVATEAPLRGMAVTFDRDDPPPRQGEPVPPGWHLAYFPEATRRRELGEDGLPLERGALPKMPLPRRMYAGATLTFHAPSWSATRCGGKPNSATCNCARAAPAR